MGSITAGIGLISGIDTASLIDSLIALESRGKVKLQQRMSLLQSQQTAILDINARLLNLKNIAGSFRKDKIFQSALALSSNEDVMTASATTAALPGTFQFYVKQLVSTSQKLSKGFADKSTTPLGLDSLTFSFGNVTLNRDVALEHLNGGQGVQGGSISIIDAAGNSGTIDLSATTSVQEVLDKINGSNAVAVKASLANDRIVTEDVSGGGGSLTISNGIGNTTASDLGIAGTSAEGVITGESINVLGGQSSFSYFNDGTGVLIRNNVTDLRITGRNGQVFNIDLGQINSPIDADTPLANLNNNAGVTISNDHDNPDIKFVDRSGVEHEVNLTGVTTVGQLITRVHNATGGAIQLSVTDGKRLTVTDTTGGDGTLQILGAGTNGTQTAADLGILNETGVDADSFTGEIIPNTVQKPAVSTIDALKNRVSEQTNGMITIAIGDDGASLKVIDNTGGTGNLIVESTAGNPYAAEHLGIATGPDGVSSNEAQGQRLIASLGSVLVRNINGGSGLGEATTINLTDRAGNNVLIGDLDAYHSLEQLVAAINQQAADAGVRIEVAVNDTGTGLAVKDTSGSTSGNLIVSGDAAAALGIEFNDAASSFHGSGLNPKYVSEASLLSDLNYGKGVGTGSFRITDGFGNAVTINVGSTVKTLQDVIQNINALTSAQNVAVRARINDTGSGLILEEHIENGGTPSVPIKVTSVSGSTAKDLNILGQSSTIHGGAFIDGGYSHTIDIDPSDTLSTVVSKINEAGVPVSASILTTGSGTNPFRLSFTSTIAGKNGELVIDSAGVDLGLATIAKGQDAKVFFGEPGTAGAFLITSDTNTVKDIVEGVTLNLHSASDSPVTVTVSRDTESIAAQIEKFVKAFNEAVAKIDEYDFFDIDTEERGLLLGNPTSSRIRAALFRAVTGRAEGVSGQFQYLHQIGVRIVEGGRLDFDQSKFEDSYASDPKAVEQLLAAYETTTTPAQEIAPGITAGSATTQTVSRGIGEIFRDLLEGLTDPFDGTIKNVENSYNSQIDLIKERIAAFDVRLEAKRKQLERQFAAMEQALAKIQGQGNALLSLQQNLLAMSQFMGR